MLSLTVAAIVFAVLHLGIASEAPATSAEIRALPSPLDFTIRLAQDNKILSKIKFEANDGKKRVLISLARVKSFSKDAPWTKLSTSSGKEVRLFQVTPSEEKFDITINVEVLKAVPLEEVIETLVRAFAGSITYDEVVFFNEADKSDRQVPSIKAVTNSEFRVKKIVISGPEKSTVSELSILKLLRYTGATSIVVLSAQPWKLTNNFFQDPAVTGTSRLELNNVEQNAITDQTLAGLKAGWVNLGKALAITNAGLRRFFQPVFDGKAKSRVIELIPAFSDFRPSVLFKDVKVAQRSSNDDSTWDIESKDRKTTLIFEKHPGDSIFYNLSSK